MDTIGAGAGTPFAGNGNGRATGTAAPHPLPFGKPVLGAEERAAVLAVLDSGVLVHGPKIKEFERAFARFTGAPHAVGVASCTAGLHLLYFHLGLSPGDEVIVPAMTHTATAHAVELTGARPVFVDAEPRTGNIDVDAIEAALTPRTRAISVVHYLGMPVDMDRVTALARRRGLPVVEDCALAVGARLDGVHMGLHGDAGCFSFYPVKHMTTAEGGMVVTRRADLAEALSLKRAFGVDRHVGERSLPGMYDVVALGFNYRMSEVEAALGVEQVKRLPAFLARRQANHQALTRALAGAPGMRLLESTDGRFQSSYYCHAVVLDDRLAPRRAAVIDRLKARGVGTSIYYPHPVPALSYYRAKYHLREEDYPVAAQLANASIALPVGPHLSPADMEHVAASVIEAVREEG
jgi:dTDP-4-amino-4,6-dideoxygalactose transaminase